MGMFAEAVEAGPQHKETRGSKCQLAIWLNAQDHETRQETLTLIADTRWPLTELEKLFAETDFKISAHTIGRHRRGLCRTCG